MKCRADIVALAVEKYKDAQCLIDNGRWDSGYYIAGYVVELLIKARVCKTLGIDDFFDFDNPQKKKLANKDGSLYRPFKIHDVNQLLVLSGIYSEFEQELTNNSSFKTAWSLIEEWNENARYLTGKTEAEAKDLLTSIQTFQAWIQPHL